jgi:hypothetical protein
MMADPTLISRHHPAIFLNRLVQSLPRLVKDPDVLVGDVELDAVPIELDLMEPALTVGHLLGG